MVYQGFNLREIEKSRQFNLMTVKVMGSPAEPGRAKAPWNWSKTPLITIINQPLPPVALPWSIRNCSHHLANSILIDFAFLRGRIRPSVQKLRTTENPSGAHLKLYLGVFLVFPKCISVFPVFSTTCEDPAQSVDSKWHIGKWIWRSVVKVMVVGNDLIPTYQTVFGLYFLYFRTVFLYAWPHGWSGLDLKFPKITSGSEIGGPSQKLWTFKVDQKVNVLAF